jgi:hypothetical protein
MDSSDIAMGYGLVGWVRFPAEAKIFLNSLQTGSGVLPPFYPIEPEGFSEVKAAES